MKKYFHTVQYTQYTAHSVSACKASLNVCDAYTYSNNQIYCTTSNGNITDDMRSFLSFTNFSLTYLVSLETFCIKIKFCRFEQCPAV